MDPQDDKINSDLDARYKQLSERITELEGVVAKRADELGSVKLFEKLIAGITLKFISVKPEGLNQSITVALEEIANFVCADRSYIFLFSSDGKSFSNTHEWCRKQVPPSIEKLQGIPIEDFPWFTKQIFDRQVVSVSDVSKLGDEAAKEKQEWLSESIRSLICVPMVCNDVLIGFSGFDTVLYQKNWSQEVESILSIVGETLASALTRRKIERKLYVSDQMMRLVLDSIPARVFWKDVNSVYTGCNKDFAKDAGLNSPEDLIGKNDYDLVWKKEESDFFRACDRRVIESDTPEYGIIEPQLRPDGTQAWLETNKVPLHDDHGQVIGILGTYNDITEKKKAEDELKRSKFCIDNAADSIFWINKDSTFFYVNDAACRSLGYSRQELLSMSVLDIDPEISKENWMVLWADVASGKKSVIESCHRDKNGRTYPVEVVINMMKFDDEEYQVAFVRNISKRKKNELALYLSEQRFRAIADYTYDWEVWISSEGTLLWTNPAVERVTGYTVDECMKMRKSLVSMFIEQDRERTARVFESAAGGSTGSNFEARIRHKNGEAVWVGISWQPIYDAKGVSQGHRASVRDISDRKRTEEAIQGLIRATSSAVGVEYIKTLVEQLYGVLGADCVFVGEIKDENLSSIVAKYVYLDGEFSDSFEYSIAKTPCEKVVASKLCIYNGNVQTVFYEDQLLIDMGVISYVGLPLFDSKNNALGVMVALYRNTIDDIEFAKLIFPLFGARVSTELERLGIETEREGLLNVLQAKTEELESIVYVSSHDLRTPLVNIQGFGGELAKSCDMLSQWVQSGQLPAKVCDKLAPIIKEDIPESLGFIRKSAAKMDMLLNGLLKLSRIGRNSLKVTAIDMNEMFSDVIITMQYQIDEKQVDILISPVPSCLGDTNQINRLFSNLLDNALKYLNATRKGFIKITGRVEDDMSVYCIEDNGIGIDQSYHDTVFEIFHRLEPGGEIKGEGLGLTIVKRIAARNKGKVWFESQEDKGCKFFVALPTTVSEK